MKKKTKRKAEIRFLSLGELLEDRPIAARAHRKECEYAYRRGFAHAIHAAHEHLQQADMRQASARMAAGSDIALEMRYAKGSMPAYDSEWRRRMEMRFAGRKP